MHRAGPTRWTTRALFALLLACTPAAALAARSDANQRAEQVLLEALGNPRLARDEVERRLCELGPDAAPRLFGCAASGFLTVEREGAPRIELPLRADLRDAAIAALAQLPSEELRARLAQLVAADPGAPGRVAALRVFEHAAGPGDLPTLLQLADAVEGQPGPSPDQRLAFRAAVGNWIARHPTASAALRAPYATTSPELAAEIVRAARGAPPKLALEALHPLLGLRQGDNAPLLTEITRAAARTQPPVSVECMESVRRQLSGNDAATLIAAIEACAELDDPAAIPALVGHLRHADPAVPVAARAALARLVRMDLGPEASAWEVWQQGETEWWLRESEDAGAAIAHGPSERAVAAVTVVCRLRMYRAQVAPMLGTGALRPEPELARLCVESLGQLRTYDAVAHLRAALGHADERVRKAARVALRRIDESARLRGSEANVKGLHTPHASPRTRGRIRESTVPASGRQR